MIIAVDTGGTKTLIAAFEHDGSTHIIEKFPTPRDTGEYIEAVASRISGHARTEDIDSVVVAVPGPIDNNVLRRAKNLDWHTFDIVESLAEHFPDTPIYLGNDADLAGIGEAQELSDNPGLCLYTTFSTGVGTGLSYDGRLLPSFGQFEGGWMRLMFEGKLQEWEQFASGSNFYARYGQYGSEVEDKDKWHDFAKRIAAGLVVLIPTLQPSTVIIGGSMGTHFAKYQRQLDEVLHKMIPEFMTSTQIVQAKHPEEAVIYGCYYYAVDQLARSDA